MAIAFEFFWLGIIPVALIIVYLAMFKLDLLLLITAFLTPLSVNLEKIGLGFGLILPTEPILFGILLIVLLKTFYEGLHDNTIMRSPVFWIILLQLIWILFTTITSSMPLVSLKAFTARMWFVVPFFFLAFYLFKDEKNIRRYFWLYVFGMAAVVIYTIMHHAQFNFGKQPAHWVMWPFFKDHTGYGAILAFVIPILIGLVKSAKVSRELKWLMILFVGLFFVAIVLSYTRAAWLSLMGAAGVYVLVLLKIRFRTVVLTAISVVGMFLLVKDELFMKLQKNKQDSSEEFSEHIQSMSNINTDASNLERINRWMSAWRMWKDRPVVGFGPGTYQFQYAPYQHPNEKTVISTNNADMGNAHSEYLGPLSEQGLPGMLIVIVLVSVVFWRGFRMYHRLPEGFHKTMTLSLLLGLITYFLHGFLNNFLDVDKASALVWASIAALAAIELYHLPRVVEGEVQ